MNMNLNQPGYYLQWSILNISVANLLIVVVMIVLFGLALLIPFPKAHDLEPTSPEEAGDIDDLSSPKDSTMWTAKVRKLWLKLLPPGKLLPDRQPAYVASWIYVFGVATLAALLFVILSGIALALGGPDWWHINPLGHFFNSIHLWSVELFMSFMIIHLWGKFWMAAWRGKRALTWVTGVLAFAVSIIQCFTGYLSQQNFDSQWIATNGKDAINPIGLGAFFNLLNFGQMLSWHIVIVPLALLFMIILHVLMVRLRGVSHPIPTKRAWWGEKRKMQSAEDEKEWQGSTIQYDILKEGTIATIVVCILILLLSFILSSPDIPPVTIASWANNAPSDFMNTAATELAGTSETATYGPPYNTGAANVQKLGISWQELAGVGLPINTAQTFVLSPLAKLAPTDPTLSTALKTYERASSSQQQSWNQAYLAVVTNVTFKSGNPIVAKANDGPIPTLIATELVLAQSGAVDADLLSQKPFYGTDYTKPLLFLEDGEYFSSLADKQNLTGSQWGVMNETGNYPGQPWLWLYTLWYQIPFLSSSDNIDLIAVYLTGIATILLLAIPFIPGLRDIPYIIPIHRFIWRKWSKKNSNHN